MFTKSLYKTDLNGKCRIWTIEVEGNAYRTISGLIDGEKVTSDWSYAHGKNIGKANGTTDEQQALRIAETLIRIRKEQGCHEDIADAAKGKSWIQPMLAGKYDAVKNKISDDEIIYIQRKLDGARCLVSTEGMQTRTGKEWISAPHIYEILKPVLEKYPDIIFDGELYVHSEEDNFNEVISLIKKTRPTEEDLQKSKEKVQYWVYDMIVPGKFFERYIRLLELSEEFPEVFNSNNIVIVTTYPCRKDMVQTYLERFVEEGFEGAIVRRDAEYEHRRSKNLLKVKQFCDEEFTIVDIEEGRGNLSGKAGRIIVDVDGVQVSAGLRFSHEEAQEIWEHREYYIGKKATIKYFNKTVDGSLRFPKAIQIDRTSYE